MSRPNSPGTPRVGIFILVLVVHAVLLVLMLRTGRLATVRTSSGPSAVEITFLAPPRAPRIAVTIPRQPLRIELSTGIALGPPTLDAAAASASLPAVGGSGQAVNWGAEARRALQAFEIRRDAPRRDATLTSPWESWWPHRDHRVGDRFKTQRGDWIVWISANCFEIAMWHADGQLERSATPQTYCENDAHAAP